MDYQAQFEYKEIHSRKTLEEEKEIQRCFGWEFVKEKSVRSGRTSRLFYIFARKKDMKNRQKLMSLEEQYYRYEKSLKHYTPITDNPEMFLLILLLVFPFVVYCLKKSNEKKIVNEYNCETKAKMNEILKIAKKSL